MYNNTENNEDYKDYEVIFDPMAKSAILRRGTNITWLKGPYRTFFDAARAASELVSSMPQKRVDQH